MTTENKVIYSMVGVSKFYDKKAVLKDIYLSYFYGAKIGVIGLNGSGKSSLLRILAGVDKDFLGETVISPGFTVGYLEQEPLIDDARTVREVVEEAVKQTVSLLKEFDEINAKFGEELSAEEMDKLLARQGEVQEKQERLRREEKSETDRQKTLQRELEWIRMSPKARHAKGQARVTAYESLLRQENEKRREDLEIPIPPGPRLGDVVIEADKVSKA